MPNASVDMSKKSIAPASIVVVPISDGAVVPRSDNPPTSSHIPDDVLLEIFHHFVHSCHHEHMSLSPRDAKLSNPYRWFRAALVCRQWRDLILGTRDFWTYVEWTPNLDWVQTVITRSNEGPIHLTMDVGKLGNWANMTSHLSLMHTIIQNLHRAYHFSFLGFMDPAVTRPVQGGVCAPWLKSVYLNGCSYDVPAKGLLFLQLGDFPSLEEVRIVGCGTPVVRRITRPSLKYLSIDGTFEGNLLISFCPYHILEILRRVSKLHTFKLDTCTLYGPATPIGDPIAPFAALPELEHFHLCPTGTSSSFHIAELLDNISFPRSAKVEISIPTRPSTAPGLISYASTRQSHTRIARRLNELEVFSAELFRQCSLSLGELSVIQGWPEPQEGHGPSHGFDREHQWRVSMHGRNLEPFLAIVPLSHVCTFKLRTHDFQGMKLEDLDVLERLINVEHLIYDGIPTLGDIQLIFQSPHFSIPSESDVSGRGDRLAGQTKSEMAPPYAMILPKLRYVEFICNQTHAGDPKPDSSAATGDDSEWIRELSIQLRSRKEWESYTREQGQEGVEVVLRGFSYVEQDTLHELRRVCSDVKVTEETAGV